MLSVIIIIKNEEKQLRRCLQSVQWADEIIVLDSGSTDNSIAIAKEFTDKVYSTDWQGYGVQKQRALDYATGTWVLSIDADEVVSDAMRQEILDVLPHTQNDAFYTRSFMHFYGKTLTYSCVKKNLIRLYKRHGARYNTNIVHESIILPKYAKKGRLKSGFIHHSWHDITHALNKMNTYSSLSAKMRKQQNKKTFLLKTIFGSFWMFFKCYFIQGGFLDGGRGFVLAVLTSENSFYRGIKMLYQDQNPS